MRKKGTVIWTNIVMVLQLILVKTLKIALIQIQIWTLMRGLMEMRKKGTVIWTCGRTIVDIVR